MLVTLFSARIIYGFHRINISLHTLGHFLAYLSKVAPVSYTHLERYGLGELKDMITFGGSPRASISLAKAARAYEFIKHRGYVIPEDVRAVAHDVMSHRIGLSYEAEASNVLSLIHI